MNTQLIKNNILNLFSKFKHLPRDIALLQLIKLLCFIIPLYAAVMLISVAKNLLCQLTN